MERKDDIEEFWEREKLGQDFIDLCHKQLRTFLASGIITLFSVFVLIYTKER